MQLSLLFNKINDNFVELPENKNAVKLLQKFYQRVQNVADFKEESFSNIIIKGSLDCGKNYLLKNFAANNCNNQNINFLDHDKINDLEFLASLKKHNLYIIENADCLEDEVLLRLINFSQERQIFIVLALSSFVNFKLKDLTSRLKNIPSATIENLSLDSIKYLLSAILSQNQINLSQAKIKKIAQNVDRSYQAVINYVKNI